MATEVLIALAALLVVAVCAVALMLAYKLRQAARAGVQKPRTVRDLVQLRTGPPAGASDNGLFTPTAPRPAAPAAPAPPPVDGLPGPAGRDGVGRIVETAAPVPPAPAPSAPVPPVAVALDGVEVGDAPWRRAARMMGSEPGAGWETAPVPATPPAGSTREPQVARARVRDEAARTGLLTVPPVADASAKPAASPSPEGASDAVETARIEPSSGVTAKPAAAPAPVAVPDAAETARIEPSSGATAKPAAAPAPVAVPDAAETARIEPSAAEPVSATRALTVAPGPDALVTVPRSAGFRPVDAQPEAADPAAADAAAAGPTPAVSSTRTPPAEPARSAAPAVSAGPPASGAVPPPGPDAPSRPLSDPDLTPLMGIPVVRPHADAPVLPTPAPPAPARPTPAPPAPARPAPAGPGRTARPTDPVPPTRRPFAPADDEVVMVLPATIALPAPAAVAGSPQPVWFRVVRRDGEAVGGVLVALMDDRGHEVDATKTATDGGGELHAPRAGRFLMIASADGFQPRAVTLTVDRQPVEVALLLPRSASVGGLVREGGAPAAGARVVARQEGEVVDEIVTGRDGGYRLDDLAEGVYVLSAFGGLARGAATGRVSLSEGGDVHLDLDLAPTRGAR
jgi:hypothetical protein